MLNSSPRDLLFNKVHRSKNILTKAVPSNTPNIQALHLKLFGSSRSRKVASHIPAQVEDDC